MCDDVDCGDERFCNGYRYGMWCYDNQTHKYVPPRRICDLKNMCADKGDEDVCQITNETGESCRRSYSGEMKNLSLAQCAIMNNSL